MPRGSSRVRILGGGKSGGGPPDQRNPYWILGLGRGRVGPWSGRGWAEVGVEVESGSLEGLCSNFVNEHTPVRFIRGGKQPTIRIQCSVHPTVWLLVDSIAVF